MANRYWVGGTATWNATAGTKWSTTSGGASGSAIPTSADDVFLDASSGVVTVTTSTGAVCLSLDCTGFTGTFNTSSFNLNIYGSLTLVAGMTLAANPIFSLNATDSRTITTGGKTLSGVSFDGAGGTWTLQDNYLSTGTFNLFIGTFNANNFNVTTGGFLSDNSNTRTLTMGSGTWTTSSSVGAWYINDPTNLTLNANTSTIKLTSATYVDFRGGGLTYNNVWFSGGSSTGDIRIFGANTFNDFKDDGTENHSIVFPNVTTTVSSFTVSGAVGKLITLKRTGLSGTWTISDSAGTNTSSRLSISNSIATGGATWNVSDGTSVFGGENTGWNFGTITLTAVVGSFILAGSSILKRLANQPKPITVLINSSKIVGYETWATITTTWASETRTWLDMDSLLTNSTKVGGGTITNIVKPV